DPGNPRAALVVGGGCPGDSGTCTFSDLCAGTRHGHAQDGRTPAPGTRAAFIAAATLLVLCALSVLLDHYHVVQDRSSDSAIYVDFLAEPLDDRAVSDIVAENALPDLVP